MAEEEFKIEVWGLFELTKKQILIFQLFFLISFIGLTAFLFAFKFPEHLGNDAYNFHAKYAKYFSLAATIMIVIETQFLWSQFTKAQLNLIKKQKAEIEQQKEEILTQNEQLIEHRERILAHQEKIEAQNKDIKASIRYASTIQNAMLPSQTKLKRLLGDYFLYYKPRDIVSGDFYWLEEYNDKTLIAAADCTGHGVPGAFVSALGISMLNDVISRAISSNEFLNPSIILNKLHQQMKGIISRTEKNSDTYDGMDVAVCMIDRKNNILEYSGALQPAYLIKRIYENNVEHFKLNVLKPDVYAISMTDLKEHSYQNTIVGIQPGDLLYLFSDGYADQFGGKKHKKFLSANFRKLLVSIAPYPMDIQLKKVEDTMRKWMGDIEQIDDMMVIGLKI